jgi:hypothetical protein
MANLQTRLVQVLGRAVEQWRNAAREAGHDVPAPDASWLSELAEQVLAEVGRDTQPYGPGSGRVPAADIRRPDLPGRRQAGDRLGEEAIPA